MKLIFRLHRYLSVLVAPAMLFFAVSGAWQAFRLQEDRKDGSYRAPVVLQTLSHLHKAEKLSPSAAVWFRTGQATLAALFLSTAVLGLVMAFRVARPVWPIWLCLAIGVGGPLAIVWLTRSR